MAISARLVVAAVLLACASGASASVASLTFGVIGDWGWGPDGDFSLLSKKNNASKLLFRDSQAAVGKGLGVICQTLKCKFVINNGDNFYNLGIDKELGVTDPQFKTSFHDIYNAKSLRVPFYGVLGNHDYGRDTEVAAHSIVPQLEYTQVDPSGQWVLPSRFYSVLPPTAGTGINVQLTMFDTSPLLKNYCTDNTSTYYTPELLYGCQESQRAAMQSWGLRKLKAARAKNFWNIAVGHHPLISGADTEPTEPLNSLLAPVLKSSAPQIWFNGHDHTLAHYKLSAVPRTNFFTVGASGIFSSGDLPASDSPYFNNFKFGYGGTGFGVVTLYSKYAIVRLYAVDVTKPETITQPTLIYTYTVQRKN